MVSRPWAPEVLARFKELDKSRPRLSDDQIASRLNQEFPNNGVKTVVALRNKRFSLKRGAQKDNTALDDASDSSLSGDEEPRSLIVKLKIPKGLNLIPQTPAGKDDKAMAAPNTLGSLESAQEQHDSPQHVNAGTQPWGSFHDPSTPLGTSTQPSLTAAPQISVSTAEMHDPGLGNTSTTSGNSVTHAFGMPATTLAHNVLDPSLGGTPQGSNRLNTFNSAAQTLPATSGGNASHNQDSNREALNVHPDNYLNMDIENSTYNSTSQPLAGPLQRREWMQAFRARYQSESMARAGAAGLAPLENTSSTLPPPFRPAEREAFRELRAVYGALEEYRQSGTEDVNQNAIMHLKQWLVDRGYETSN